MPTSLTLVCVTVGGDAGPPYAALPLARELAQRLLGLRDWVRPLWGLDGFYGASFFDHTCRFGASRTLDGCDLQPGEWYGRDGGPPPDWAAEATSASQLVVKDDGVLWRAYSKYGPAEDFESETVRWEWVEAAARGERPDVEPADPAAGDTA